MRQTPRVLTIAAPAVPLLLVLLHDVRRPDSSLIRVFAELPERAALTQEIPALVQFDLNLLQPPMVGIGQGLLAVEPMFFFDKMFDVFAHGLVEVFVGHRQSALTKGTSTTCSERNQACFSLPRTTSETRRSFVPSSPEAAACRAIERASSRMIS